MELNSAVAIVNGSHKEETSQLYIYKFHIVPVYARLVYVRLNLGLGLPYIIQV